MTFEHLLCKHPAMIVTETSHSASVRPAVVDDANRIACLFIQSAEYHARIDPGRYSPPSLEAISAYYWKELQNFSDIAAARTIFVAELAGEIVGFVEARIERSGDLMHKEMTYCHISEIAVSSCHQNRGIGSQLLIAAEDWGRVQGAFFASLEYHIANRRAAGFYQQGMGYAPAATIAIKPL